MKKGVIEKKHPKFSTWSKRNVILVPNKIFYYEPGNDVQAKGVLDFNLISCTIGVKKNQSNIFKLQILKSNREFYFRCQDEKEAKEWIKAISDQITSSKGYQKNLSRVSIQPKFWKLDRISQSELMEIADTGDIVLFRTYGMMPIIQRIITWSRIGTIS